MNIREEQEKYEHEHLSRFASFSDESQGRDRPEEPCTVRPAYQRDRDRILHCKSFRRLKHKTQFFCRRRGIITERGLRTHWRCPRLQEQSAGRCG